MNELQVILNDTVERLFTDAIDRNLREDAEASTWPAALWSAVLENGLAHVLVPEDQGGVGAGFAEAEIIVRGAGRHGAPIPLPEAILAHWLLARAGLALPDGIVTLAPVRQGDALRIADGKVTGQASRVPWGRHGDHVVVVAASGAIACVAKEAFTVEAENQNVACEPRDSLAFDSAVASDVGQLPDGLDAVAVLRYGAMIRASQMAGALERVLETTVTYANDRTQFGRPIGKFQAVQQALAVLAGNTAASGAAATAAFNAADGGDPAFEMMVAKIRAGNAAGSATSIAHQAHGAIGFTYEHELHYFTRRLWSWRDEFGGDAYWAEMLGRQVCADGGDQLWPFLTTR